MATSTFGKQFKVTRKTKRFEEEMSKKVAPTLKRDFKSNLVHGKDLKEYLQKVLK